MKLLCVKQSLEATDELYSLACGPDNQVHTYIRCIVNGVRFHTKDSDDRCITQNSGICVSGEHDGEEVDFYGVLSNVVVLNYILGYKVILFKCSWFDTNRKKKKIKHDHNFTSIQVSSTWYKNDPFILATQAQQVFYLDDYKNGPNWKVVQKVNHRHMWDVPEKGSCLEVGKEVCGGSEDDAYQENESRDLNWFFEEGDGSGLRPDRLDTNPKIVNGNVLSLETMNDCDDDFICDDFEVEIVCLYVDDMLILGSSNNIITATKKMLSKKFDMKDLGVADVILGIKISRTSSGLALSQSHYIKKILEKFGKNSRINLHLSKNTGQSISQLEYSRIIGSLMYVMNCTRPDITYSFSKLSRYISNPGIDHWKTIIRVLRYLRNTLNYGLNYTRYLAVLEGYSDANWISDMKDTKSTSSYVFTLGGVVVS